MSSLQLHVLSAGRLAMRKSVYIPGAAREEMIELPVLSFLLRHAQGNVLFDTGCHPDAATDPQGRWGGMSRIMRMVSPPQEHLLNSLAEVGLQPQDIDVVVNSHLHTDHCGCNVFFRRATVHVHAAELAAARADDAEQQGFLARDWQPALQQDGAPAELLSGLLREGQSLRPLQDQLDLFGDGRVTLIPLPGHTPGTTGLLAALERDAPMLLVSDAVALRHHYDQRLQPRNTWNVEQADRSLQEIRRIEASGATVIFGHDAQQADGLRKGQAHYD